MSKKYNEFIDILIDSAYCSSESYLIQKLRIKTRSILWVRSIF